MLFDRLSFVTPLDPLAPVTHVIYLLLEKAWLYNRNGRAWGDFQLGGWGYRDIFWTFLGI